VSEISKNLKTNDHRTKWMAYWDQLDKLPSIKPLFTGLSILYGFCVYLREKAYSQKIFSTNRLPRPVFSVGNLTVGGTGKTPVVSLIARFLINNGQNPVILTRGYKRKNKKHLTIISDAEDIPALPEETGDEPYMLARWLPEVPIIVSKYRYKSGIFALKKFSADCFILDDGFQHLQLYRDLNILVINARDPFGGGKLLPSGRLREPLSSLRRASLIIINKAQDGQNLNPIYAVIRQYNSHAPIIEASYTTEYLASASNLNQHIPLSEMKGRSVLAFSGIAEPNSFLEQLKNTGASIVNAIIFSDHHWYSKMDLDRIREIAKASDVQYIVTTEKDGVRIPPGLKDDIYILIMKIGLKGSHCIFENMINPILVQ
jgi:tetraacyldisaccharide 4'-kinase